MLKSHLHPSKLNGIRVVQQMGGCVCIAALPGMVTLPMVQAGICPLTRTGCSYLHNSNANEQ